MQATPVDTAKSFSIHSPAQDCVCDTPELNACEKAHKTSLDLGCRDKLEVGARSVATINQRLLGLSIHVLFTHRWRRGSFMPSKRQRGGSRQQPGTPGPGEHELVQMKWFRSFIGKIVFLSCFFYSAAFFRYVKDHFFWMQNVTRHDLGCVDRTYVTAEVNGRYFFYMWNVIFQ